MAARKPGLHAPGLQRIAEIIAERSIRGRHEMARKAATTAQQTFIKNAVMWQPATQRVGATIGAPVYQGPGGTVVSGSMHAGTTSGTGSGMSGGAWSGGDLSGGNLSGGMLNNAQSNQLVQRRLQILQQQKAQQMASAQATQQAIGQQGLASQGPAGSRGPPLGSSGVPMQDNAGNAAASAAASRHIQPSIVALQTAVRRLATASNGGARRINTEGLEPFARRVIQAVEDGGWALDKQTAGTRYAAALEACYGAMERLGCAPRILRLVQAAIQLLRLAESMRQGGAGPGAVRASFQAHLADLGNQELSASDIAGVPGAVAGTAGANAGTAEGQADELMNTPGAGPEQGHGNGNGPGLAPDAQNADINERPNVGAHEARRDVLLEPPPPPNQGGPGAGAAAAEDQDDQDDRYVYPPGQEPDEEQEGVHDDLMVPYDAEYMERRYTQRVAAANPQALVQNAADPINTPAPPPLIANFNSRGVQGAASNAGTRRPMPPLQIDATPSPAVPRRVTFDLPEPSVDAAAERAEATAQPLAEMDEPDYWENFWAEKARARSEREDSRPRVTEEEGQPRWFDQGTPERSEAEIDTSFNRLEQQLRTHGLSTSVTDTTLPTLQNQALVTPSAAQPMKASPGANSTLEPTLPFTSPIEMQDSMQNSHLAASDAGMTERESDYLAGMKGALVSDYLAVPNPAQYFSNLINDMDGRSLYGSRDLIKQALATHIYENFVERQGPPYKVRNMLLRRSFHEASEIVDAHYEGKLAEQYDDVVHEHTVPINSELRNESSGSQASLHASDTSPASQASLYVSDTSPSSNSSSSYQLPELLAEKITNDPATYFADFIAYERAQGYGDDYVRNMLSHHIKERFMDLYHLPDDMSLETRRKADKEAELILIAHPREAHPRPDADNSESDSSVEVVSSTPAPNAGQKRRHMQMDLGEDAADETPTFRHRPDGHDSAKTAPWPYKSPYKSPSRLVSPPGTHIPEPTQHELDYAHGTMTGGPEEEAEEERREKSPAKATAAEESAPSTALATPWYKRAIRAAPADYKIDELWKGVMGAAKESGYPVGAHTKKVWNDEARNTLQIRGYTNLTSKAAKATFKEILEQQLERLERGRQPAARPPSPRLAIEAAPAPAPASPPSPSTPPSAFRNPEIQALIQHAQLETPSARQQVQHAITSFHSARKASSVRESPDQSPFNDESFVSARSHASGSQAVMTPYGVAHGEQPASVRPVSPPTPPEPSGPTALERRHEPYVIPESVKEKQKYIEEVREWQITHPWRRPYVHENRESLVATAEVLKGEVKELRDQMFAAADIPTQYRLRDTIRAKIKDITAIETALDNIERYNRPKAGDRAPDSGWIERGEWSPRTFKKKKAEWEEQEKRSLARYDPASFGPVIEEPASEPETEHVRAAPKKDKSKSKTKKTKSKIQYEKRRRLS